jgi:hypothetical protein
LRDDAAVPRPPIRTLLGVLLVLSVAACGDDDGGDGACGPIQRESLDSAYLVHVVGDDTGVEYTSDPPTSGPHQAGPPVAGVLEEPLPRPVQVGILERGDVLVQHGPDVDAADLAELGREGVVIAPNADLPAPVVATAWTYKRTCDAVDIAALREFIEERGGKGPE